VILCLSPCHIIFVSHILLSCDAYNNSFCAEILECERSPEVLILNEVVWIRLPFVLRFHMILYLFPCIIFASHILWSCDAYNNWSVSLFCAEIFECEIFCDGPKFQLPIFYNVVSDLELDTYLRWECIYEFLLCSEILKDVLIRSVIIMLPFLYS